MPVCRPGGYAVPYGTEYQNERGAIVAHELHAEDRQAIGEILALRGHLFDGGRLGRLGEIFAPDAVYAMSALGAGTFEGIEAVRGAALRLGPGNPVAHHLANVVVSGGGDGTATALSKGLALMADGTLASVAHLDTLRRHDGGRRISRRVITPQRTPRAEPTWPARPTGDPVLPGARCLLPDARRLPREGAVMTESLVITRVTRSSRATRPPVRDFIASVPALSTAQPGSLVQLDGITVG